MLLSLLHAAIVHFPIALLICGSLALLGYAHRWPRVELRIIGWGLLLPGWLTLLGAIVSGIVAQGRLPTDAPYRSLLNWHTASGLALAAVYADLLYRGWLHSMRKDREETVEDAAQGFLMANSKRKWLLTAQLLLGVGLVIMSGWLGGQLVYEYGVGVR